MTATTDAPALDDHARAALEARAQALEDLAFAESASVCFVRHRGGATGEAFFDALEDRALAMNFVVSRVSIFESRAFDALDVLVRACSKDLRASARGSKKRARGIVALLEAFLARHQDGQALARFDDNAKLFAAGGDLHALCRAYIEAAQHQAREAARIEAWLEGTNVSRAESASITVGSLGAENAQRALAERSSLVKALGHRGLLLLFERGESLTKLSAARRETAYVVLRELIDNADGGRGLRSAHLVVGASDALFSGSKSIQSLPPLHARVRPTRERAGELAPPHAPYVDIEPPITSRATRVTPVRPVPNTVTAGEMRTLVRASQGLPPVEAVDSLSVGIERIALRLQSLHERVRGARVPLDIDALLARAELAGSTRSLVRAVVDELERAYARR